MNTALIIGLVLEALIAVVLVIGAVALLARRSGTDTGGVLRRIFRYGILLVLMILVGTGLTGLVALADPDVAAGPGYTAFMLACVIVGGPGLALVSRWVIRALDRSGGVDPGWDIYLVVAEWLSLVAAATGAYIWGEGLTEGRFRITPAAVMMVWGIIWFSHHALAGRRGRAGRLRYGVLLGSLTGLATGAVFGIRFLEAVLGRLYDVLASAVVIAERAAPIPSALIGMVIWGAVWVRYWWFIGMQEERTALWRAYVLLPGVVGGLFTSLVGLWSLTYRILDWLVGDSTDPARLHFEHLPLALALIVIGGVAWRYHRTILRSPVPAGRTEVDRAHEYTVVGAGLVATVSGLGSVIAASVQAFLPAALVDLSDRSDLVAAVTLLIVGGPLWWRYWTSVQRVRRADPESELRSPTRRIFLICVFGAGGVVALGSLFVLAYRVLEALLERDLGTATVFAIRWPLALAVTVGLAAAYHRAIRRADVVEAPEEPSGPQVRSVILVGSSGHEVARAVAAQTGVEVQVWDRADVEASVSQESLVEAIESSEYEYLLVVARPEGPEVIPYTR